MEANTNITTKKIPKIKNLNALKLDLIQWITTLENEKLLKKLKKIKKNNSKKKSKQNPPIPTFEEKNYYAIEDLIAIKKQFPSNKKWKFNDLQTFFPKNLKHKVEILNNRLLIMPTPSFIHQKISSELFFEMKSFIKVHKLGEILSAPMDTKFDDDNCVQPDILYIEVSRYSIIKENYIEGSPDLVVEIWSPSNKKRERDEKHTLYESKGVKEYWTIFPKKREVIVEKLENNTFQIHSQGKKTGIIQSSILEGFEIKIEDLMPESLFVER